jgi:3-phosphoshikimate 1-carboxyvinyltransferase
VNVRIVRSDRPLCGSVRVPGDKSISHRAVLLAAMAEGCSRLTGVLDSADVRASIAAVQALGARVEIEGQPASASGLDLVVEGWGRRGPLPPGGAIDCGNSGTTARLLLGILTGARVECLLTGDASLSRRPMRRVADPLERMGATIELSDAGTLPALVVGGQLRAIRYESPVASAQVKSAILLAGLGAQGRTVVLEPSPSRDHTERMLPAFGAGVGRDAGELASWVDGPVALVASDVAVPGDPSSAAFLAGAALLVQGSTVALPEITMNPTRIGFIGVLAGMGADLEVEIGGHAGAEPVGALRVSQGLPLAGVRVDAEQIASLIDEIPLLAVVASQAVGTTRFDGVGELRVKESDRLAALEDGLTTLGVVVRSGEDWLEVDGPARLRGGTLDSLGDHRLAMSWAVAGLAAESPVTICGWEAVGVSYPRFEDDLAALAGAPVVLSC